MVIIQHQLKYKLERNTPSTVLFYWSIIETEQMVYRSQRTIKITIIKLTINRIIWGRKCDWGNELLIKRLLRLTEEEASIDFIKLQRNVSKHPWTASFLGWGPCLLNEQGHALPLHIAISRACICKTWSRVEIYEWLFIIKIKGV